MIGNIIAFNSIYQKIVAADAAGDNTQEAFLYGKLANILINFNPIDYAPNPKSVKSQDPFGVLPDSMDELFNIAGIGEDAESAINRADAFISNLFRTSISSIAVNSEDCQGNSTMMFNAYSNFREQVKQHEYNETAESVK